VKQSLPFRGLFYDNGVYFLKNTYLNTTLKTIHKAYRFALLPTKEQEVLLNKHFGHTRWVYNHFLHERIEQYRENKTSDNYYQQSALLTQLKKQEDTRWLKEVNSQALQTALRDLDIAFCQLLSGQDSVSNV